MSSTASTTKTNKMPAAKKTEKKTEVAAPAPAPVSTPAPVVEKKEKKVKAAKPATETSAQAVVAVPTPETPVVVAAPASTEVQLSAAIEKLKAAAADLSARLREVVKGIEAASKQAKREQKDSKKKKRKSPEQMTPEERKAWEARRANNAFLVQRPLTDELSAFMGLPAGSKRSQTEVTKFISEYVKTHGCYDKDFKRRIVPNPALSKLLRVPDGKEVTYLNLQSFLKVHFKKVVQA